MRRTRLRAGTALLLAAVVAPAASLTAVAGPAAVPSKPFVQGTETVPAYDYDNAIHERVQVDAPELDGDANGITDQITVDIIRPAMRPRPGSTYR